MYEMAKGANIALAALSEQAGSVTVGLGWSSESGDGDADVSVLLLGADQKVRSDADFIFYNNPAAADGSVQLLGTSPAAEGSEDRIGLDLTAVPEDVRQIVVAASRYGGAPFSELRDLRLTLTDGDGDRLLRFAIGGAGEETAFVFGEFYRRAGGWKFRAVGQGYATGLAGLATDFGIDVDDGPDDGPEGAPDGGAADAEAKHELGSVSGELTADGEGGAPVSAGTGETPGAAPLDGVPRPRAAVEETAPEAAASRRTGRETPRRPRTKKKVTLAQAPKKSLGENDSWRPARLFPVPSLKSDREREVRATSVLLSVMAQVPEFGRRLTAAFGAPAGRMETFTEVTLPNGDSPCRPDGVIRVERAGRLWTALLETKTNGNPLITEQVQDYMDVAVRRGYEAVITLSNDVALEGSPFVEVKTDGRRKHKVALWHLSWAEVAHQVRMLILHEGVGNLSHAWLLQELLHYLQHENSGCHGFQNMGRAWVPVRDAIDEESLIPGDPRAVAVVESWERLIRQVSLELGGGLGRKALPVERGRRGSDPAARRAADAERLCEDGRLTAGLRIEGAPGILELCADLRTGKLRTSMEAAAPAQGYPLSWVKRLVRQLAGAPSDLRIETLTDSQAPGPRGPLEKLRPEPADLLPKDGSRITGFRLSLLRGMGSTRGTAQSGFIRSVNQAVDTFCGTVAVPLEERPPRRGSPAAV